MIEYKNNYGFDLHIFPKAQGHKLGRYQMKTLYINMLVVEQIILLFFLLKIKMKKQNITTIIVRLLTSSSIAIMANIGIMYLQNERMSLIAYCVSFIATDWMLYYMLRFAFEYTGYAFIDNKDIRKLFYALVVDALIMEVNIFTKIAFSVESVVMPDHIMYNRLNVTPLYYYHLGLAYGMVACTMGCLLYKSYKAVTLYARKYFIVFLSMIPAVVCEYFYFRYHEAIDASVLGHGITAVAIYYCAFVYSPQKLLFKSMVRVVQNSDELMLLLDMNKNVIYMNPRAEDVMDKIDRIYDGQGRTLRTWYEENCVDNEAGYLGQTKFYYKDRVVHMAIRSTYLYDKKGRVQGILVTAMDMSEEVQRREAEIYNASHDQLTGIYNQSYFYEKCKQALQERPNEPYVMVCSDIRNFKLVNDVFGAFAGDHLLMQIGTHLRNSMVPEVGEVCGRLGNDRFAFLMPKKRYREEVFLDAVRYVSYVSEDASYPVDISVGVYEIQDVTLPISVMCDRALMAIKENRSNYQKKIAYYDEEMRNSVLREQELTSDLKIALEEEQLQIYLQPQISVTGDVLGGEALVRWFHPTKGQIYPNDFIPVFEKNGMIAKLDRYIWECAARQLSEWKKQGHDEFHIAVNISPKDFYLLDVYTTFVNLVKKYDINPMNLKLEITESAVMMDLERQLELINRLQQVGFIIEMDDFGSGYSSLNMLKEIKVDVLKIDMAFVRKSTNDERGKKILQMIINLSKQLGMPVISEGVETAEQVRFLTDIGCDVFQGYYFAKPMDVREFEERYMNKNG